MFTAISLIGMLMQHKGENIHTDDKKISIIQRLIQKSLNMISYCEPFNPSKISSSKDELWDEKMIESDGKTLFFHVNKIFDEKKIRLSSCPTRLPMNTSSTLNHFLNNIISY